MSFKLGYWFAIELYAVDECIDADPFIPLVVYYVDVPKPMIQNQYWLIKDEE